VPYQDVKFGHDTESALLETLRQTRERTAHPTLSIAMANNFKKMGAFFRNVSASCAGGSGCTFKSISPASVSSDAQSASVSYKTWSIPVTITLEAEVCIYDKNTLAPSAKAGTDMPTLGPAKPVIPVVAKAPPHKLHELSEAGALTPADCNRMKSNWRIEARNYCGTFAVNLLAANLTCETQNSAAHFRAVSGTIVCN
jgi:hypothetical protein